MPDEDLEPSGEDPELLQQALDSLPAADKASLLMFYSDDLSVRDIAEVTGMTESNPTHHQVYLNQYMHYPFD